MIPPPTTSDPLRMTPEEMSALLQPPRGSCEELEVFFLTFDDAIGMGGMYRWAGRAIVMLRSQHELITVLQREEKTCPTPPPTPTTLF